MKIIGNKDACENPVDTQYQGLKCDLSALSQEEETFQLIEKYVRQTHAKTHNQYKLKVMDVFEVNRHGEEEQFKDVGNR